jgi:hypothetical protein
VGVRIAEIVVADAPAPWARLGFDVRDEVCVVGSVPIRLAGTDAGRGLVSWSLAGLASRDLDGLPTSLSDVPEGEAAGSHPNCVVSLDHVVAFTPDLDRTAAALERAGLDLRRVREEPTPAGAPRQAFFRLADVILEVIQVPDDSPMMAEPDGPARLWGLAFTIEDLDRLASEVGDDLSEPRDAVQPGRKIATLRRSAGLSVPLAFMTPAP